ncbi:MAG TPA: hypothetical protein PL110_04160 [Candidatus Eremiobacteraeota bacterium]|nr:MAG: hypothetical protein BWY64_01618 [bacterium ADurb.Bin363]HPZ07282.1 hypothetical protein [Candidatus Eremiobacteraeota bacterium]
MEKTTLLEKICEYIFKGLFAVIIIIGTIAFILLTISSIDKFLDILVDTPKETMSLLFTLVGPLGILIVGGLCLDMAKTLYDQEIKSLPKISLKKTSEDDEDKTSQDEDKTSSQELSSTEKTNRFISRFIAIVVTFLVVEFSTIAFQYQHRPDAGIDLIALIKAGLSLMGAAILLLMWSLFLKD